MKHLLLLSVLAAAILLPASCTNNSNAADAPASGATASPATNEGSLAFTLDGTKRVIKRPASSIFINEVSHDAAKGSVLIEVTIYPSAELFKFIVADKGTTNVLHYQPSFGEEKIAATYLSPAGQNYYGVNVSITISSLNAAHMTGTFSGKFASEDKFVTVTDGSFDLPMKAKK